MGSFLVVVIAVGWAISYYFNNPGILFFAVLFALATNIFAYWNSDKVAIAMSGAKPAEEAQYGDLHNIVENLAITAGLPKPRVYIIDDPAPNAFATGRNKEHAAIAVTTGLLGMMDRTELEGVLAHELSHVGNRDILVSTVAVVLVGFVSLASDFFLRTTMWGGRGSDKDSKSNPFLAILAVALIVLAPIVATLMQLAISRKREFLADASGALLTRYPEGLANALRKIGAYASPMKRANTATAHLFISNPFGAAAARSGLAKLFMTHPPIADRIKALVGNE
ncbi:zinc metalloprotease HtpX [Candidatus Kaiserbacteria bacterium]|nr:zinc metalloprotease HtpX [Candidatus Kaiserbacteria bacterium]